MGRVFAHYADEVTGLARIVTDPIVELGVHLVRLPLQLLGPIFSKLGDGRLGRVVSAAILVDPIPSPT